jgi:hypothetical protein
MPASIPLDELLAALDSPSPTMWLHATLVAPDVFAVIKERYPTRVDAHAGMAAFDNHMVVSEEIDLPLGAIYVLGPDAKPLEKITSP